MVSLTPESAARESHQLGLESGLVSDLDLKPNTVLYSIDLC